MNGLISLSDLDSRAFRDLVGLARRYGTQGATLQPVLAGKVIATWFTKTSTRTRCSFSSAILRLGGGLVSLEPGHLQSNTGESLEDTARMLGLYFDGVVARTCEPTKQLRQIAELGRMRVVNAMSEEEHPSQVIGDFATLAQHFGDLEGLRLMYVGEGNNTANALVLAAAKIPGMHATFATPPGFGLDPEYLERARVDAKTMRARIVELHELPEDSPRVDVVYTTRWQTTGAPHPGEDWRRVFAPFALDSERMEALAAGANSVLLHDLPAVRGEEITADLLEGPRSLVWEHDLGCDLSVRSGPDASTGRTVDA